MYLPNKSYHPLSLKLEDGTKIVNPSKWAGQYTTTVRRFNVKLNRYIPVEVYYNGRSKKQASSSWS